MFMCRSLEYTGDHGVEEGRVAKAWDMALVFGFLCNKIRRFKHALKRSENGATLWPSSWRSSAVMRTASKKSSESSGRPSMPCLNRDRLTGLLQRKSPLTCWPPVAEAET